jgi:hypothetical protein
VVVVVVQELEVEAEQVVIVLQDMDLLHYKEQHKN